MSSETAARLGHLVSFQALSLNLHLTLILTVGVAISHLAFRFTLIQFVAFVFWGPSLYPHACFP